VHSELLVWACDCGEWVKKRPEEEAQMDLVRFKIRVKIGYFWGFSRGSFTED